MAATGSTAHGTLFQVQIDVNLFDSHLGQEKHRPESHLDPVRVPSTNPVRLAGLSLIQ